MPGNKKRRKFNSNNAHNRGSSSGRYQRPGTQRTPITVREKKRQMIRERVLPDEEKRRGMRSLGLIVTVLLLLRAALFVYELVFYISNGVKVGVVSNLLLLPLILILFMVKDGNRGLIGICAVSAVVRMIVLFVSVYPSLEAIGGAVVFTAVYAVIMAVQFILSVVALSMPSTDAFAKEMQMINMEIRTLIMQNRR